ncbi:glycoside hydrolase family 3 protein [Sphingomonas sp. S6]|jgi:beta-glucosidase|uniref:glycoside hydrolase family 3 protein n=1 Tax=Sphingomonas sp. S6 TaxID=3368600 RepID=UPI000F9ED62F|nr:glycoside hydrolase family 3 protein [uncultured Sphingomonas sp.]RTL19074.1 MAG: glycoside hydrolase family 3 protein [Sphingomonadaceae bacterium]
MAFSRSVAMIVAASALAAGTVTGEGLAQQGASAGVAHPELWPTLPMKLKRDPKVEARVDAILKRMSVEDKVGQMIQVDIASITPKDLETYKIGSVLNGGNSAPNSDEFAPAAEWLKLFDAFYDASVKRSDGRPVVPIIWGTDAVHGDNNIVGATLFPHNIGLGATRDPALIRRIGAATAAETAATGIDWSFAPTVAVVQDDRWGRTYESYSEEPEIVQAYAGQMVEGLQGTVGQDFMTPGHVISSVKHFLGDGGTGGRDQGDTRVSEQVLRDVHAAGYKSGLAAGALTVMPSFSSWNGVKMTGNKSLLTGVLKQRMGFDGFAIGDWNAHGQVPGCSNEDCPAAINAGLDMFMYSGSKWKELYANTLREAKDGTIPAARLDDAVRRILRVKMLAGTFDAGRPSSRPMAGKFDLLGAPAHRAIARQAVRESLVLLKNNGGVLPLKPSANILVAGRGADNIGQQSGGWSITWQGTGVTNAAFPNGQSIWSGIDQAVRAGGGKATLAVDGAYTTKPDAAIVVFGETPYAEFTGDRPTLEYSPEDKSDLALLKKLKAAGIPVVAVFLSGRPLWVNPELNAADAFVAAFLPGTEGGGVADVLIAGRDGKPRNDFHGTLSVSWPKRLDQYVLNRRDPNYDPLFPFGYGLTYAKGAVVPQLSEARPAGGAADQNALFVRGRIVPGARLETQGPVQLSRVDRNSQEDSLRLVFAGTGAANAYLDEATPIDLTRETNGDLSLIVDYRVTQGPTAEVTLGVLGKAAGAVPITGALKGEVGEWRQIAVPLRCFAQGGATMGSVQRPWVIATTGRLGMDVSGVRIASAPPGPVSCGTR